MISPTGHPDETTPGDSASANGTRLSSADWVAARLRAQIIEGDLTPGSRLSEERLGRALGVSRNTLREAFRLLAHDQLVVHTLNSGVRVATLAGDDISDLYGLRRIIETAAVRRAEPDQLEELRRVVEIGEAAAQQQRWSDVARADLAFHQQLVRLCRSPRLDDLMRRCLAELRLAFHMIPEAAAFYEPYLKRNRQILGLLEIGDFRAAATELHDYLDDAERELLAFTRAWGS